MNFEELVELVGKLVDATGIAAIILGVAVAIVRFLIVLARQGSVDDAYRGFRRGVGRAILLGLELLVAADIIRTVGIDPSFTDVGVLAGIVAIRTFLGFALELELEGRWPWQRNTPDSMADVD